jgi:hypothetical protein
MLELTFGESMYEEIVALQKEADTQLAIFASGADRLEKQMRDIKASCQGIASLETRLLLAGLEPAERVAEIQHYQTFLSFLLAMKGFRLTDLFVVPWLRLGRLFVALAFSTRHKVSIFLLRYSLSVPFLRQRSSNIK